MSFGIDWEVVVHSTRLVSGGMHALWETYKSNGGTLPQNICGMQRVLLCMLLEPQRTAERFGPKDWAFGQYLFMNDITVHLRLVAVSSDSRQACSHRLSWTGSSVNRITGVFLFIVHI